MSWIRARARPLAIDPQAPLADLEPLGDLARHAVVVAFGGTRQAHELTLLRFRALRFLVERLGFRSLALEEDWTKGAQLDEHVRTGAGTGRKLLGDARFSGTEEMVDVVAWIRQWNEEHPADIVRILGADVTAVRPLAYDAVIEFVRQAAPSRLEELEALYEVLRSSRPIAEHVAWYRSRPDKQRFVDFARRAVELVEAIPPAPGHALALRHARVVVAFHEFHGLDTVGYADERLAESTVWWHEHTGHRIVYWGGTPHIANRNPGPSPATEAEAAATSRFLDAVFSPDARPSAAPPPSPGARHRSAGSHLREHFGSGYVAVGMTFHHGWMPYPVPAPQPDWLDAVLGDVGLDAYLLDFRAPQPDVVRAWLEAPARTRVLGPFYDPENDAAHHMAGGSLSEWFDAVVHSQELTPTRSLGSPLFRRPSPV